MPGGAFSQDVLTSIVNVNWGGGIIVVFMEVSPWTPQPVFILTPEGGAATLLASWETPSYSTDPAPFKNSAYQVTADAGVFLTSTAPDLPSGSDGVAYDINGTWLNVLVFAVADGNIEASLAQAKAGTKLMAPALYLVNLTNADLPSEVAPPGLLWGITTGAFTAGVSLQWKIRSGEHRDPETSPEPPPNSMVQCYPLASSHPGYVGDVKVTYSGYYLIAYRLDPAGTGDVYSKAPAVTDTGTQNLPPEWSATIVTGPFPSVGIPFADPPPLISADVK
jgi:hypothetical protein